MKFLGEQCNKFPCPDSETVKHCRGKVEIMIESYRITAHGSGAFAISVPKRVQCNECGRVFKTANFLSRAENHILFDPV